MMDFSGWQSPVNIIQTQMSMEMEGEIMRAVQKVGVIVNKQELINALRYDRGQYDKGFMNGYNKAIDDAIKIVKENYRIEALERLEQLKAGGENEH